jgi:hypothetical protein
MISLSRLACGALLALALAGCQGSSDSASSSASKADKSATPNYTIIQRGRPPISTMVTVPGQVQIVDLDDNGKVVLKKTKIAGNTLVTMNPGSLTLNMSEVSRGPFSRQHTYEFRLYR